MAKLGVSVRIDVSKIDKSRLFKGAKGTYLDLTTFIDTENEGKFGDHGFISQSLSKEEREQQVQTPILGNVKVFYTGDSSQQQQPQPASPSAGPDYGAQGGADYLDDAIPF